MGLHEVTRDSVLDAVDEYDDLGRDGFLARYGFAGQVDVVLEYVGQKYDGMAVLAAGHGFLTGTPLTSAELSDKEPEVAERLARLQFHVLCTPKVKAPTRARKTAASRRATTSRASRSAGAASAAPVSRGEKRLPMPDWTVEPGDVVARKQLALIHGDPMTRHIEPTGRTRNVLVFADPYRESHAHDGWDAERTAYFVTGEGRRGDQSWTAGNQALRSHVEEGRAVRLFEVEQAWRPGGKQHCYLGEFVLCPEQPYRMDVAPDDQGADRQVIVFKLVAKDAAQQAAAPDASAGEAGQVIDLGQGADLREQAPTDLSR